MTANVTLQKNVIVYGSNIISRSGSYNQIDALLNGVNSIDVRCASYMMNRRIKKLQAAGFVISKIVREISTEELSDAQYIMESI